MDIEHYANGAMSRAVLHLWRQENYAKYEISMSYGNIQANNVIRFESPRQYRFARESRKRLATYINELAARNKQFMVDFPRRFKGYDTICYHPLALKK